MSAFDAAAFMDATVSEVMDDKFIPVPAGEYPATATKVETRNWQGKKDPSQSGIALDIQWEIEDQKVKEVTGRDKVTVKQGIMLDLTEQGGIDIGKGKNIALGALRTALGMNSPGQSFSFRMIEGRRAKVKVTQRVDGDKIYNDVAAVTKP